MRGLSSASCVELHKKQRGGERGTGLRSKSGWFWKKEKSTTLSFSQASPPSHPGHPRRLGAANRFRAHINASTRLTANSASLTAQSVFHAARPLLALGIKIKQSQSNRDSFFPVSKLQVQLFAPLYHIFTDSMSKFLLIIGTLGPCWS